MTRFRFLLATAVLTGLAFTQAQAQTTPVRLHATLNQVDGDALQATTAGEAKITVTLTDHTRIGGLTAATLADVTKDSYVGCGAMTQPDGTMRAMEVTIFPPEMRGTGDGFRPWTEGPQSTMTNGAVGNVTAESGGGAKGGTLVISYKGGEKTIAVPADTPIVKLAIGTRALLTQGAHVTIFADKAADGTLTARNVTVGLGGLVPPV